ncbi:NUDIX hydrolase [Bounagaea algeriensis]
MAERHPVDVHVLLVSGTSLLLSKRRDAHGEFDGMWHLPSGKLEAGESVLDAARREVAEEIGVRLAASALRHVHTAHVTAPGLEPRLGLFFEARDWEGEPVNREPAKCSELRWFDLDELPVELISYPAAGIRGYRTGRSLSTPGWPASTGVSGSSRPPEAGGRAHRG